MKEKLEKARLQQSHEQLLGVLSEILFLEDTFCKKKRYTLREIIEQVRYNFLRSGGVHLFNERVSNVPSQYTFLNINPKATKLDIIQIYLAFFLERCPYGGCGFTPKFSMKQKFLPEGYNCLGGALLFAAFMGQYMKVELAHSPDHAMCICYDEDQMYLCNPVSGKFWVMHGTICSHDTYGWYPKVVTDEFHFNYLVVHSVEYGGFYLILKTFEYLATLKQDYRFLRKQKGNDYEFQLLRLLNPRLPYQKLLRKIDWSILIRHIFPEDPYENYETYYRKEWLLETEIRRRFHEESELREQFDRSFFHAIRATHFKGTMKDFNKMNIVFLKIRPDQVIYFLDLGLVIDIELPKQTMTFLTILRNLIQDDKELKDYVLKKIKKGLFDTVM